MDVSQQTPTQANEDRDYADITDSLPSTGHDASKPDTTEEEHERTLNPEDTGAVNFGTLSQSARPSSQVSEDAGFEITRGGWSTTQQNTGSAYTPFKTNGVAPETPAVPRNPFGAKPSIAAPFAGSQLFGQTQFSSAVKPNAFSPTSSRPSPNIVHDSISPNIAETSPLKNRANISSPTEIRSSSPNRAEDVPATVIRPPALDRIEEETPSLARSIRQQEEAIPQSPTHPPPRSSSSRQPLARYESVKRSQERKTQVDYSHTYTFVGSDSDDDPITKQFARRKLAEKKKAQAAQEMERVSFTPRAQRASRERPGIKRRRTTQGDDVAIINASRSKSAEPVKGSSGQPLVVADSQQKEDPSGRRSAHDGATQGTEGTEPEAELMQVDKPTAVEAANEQLELDDKIPASSPAPSPSPDVVELDAIPQSEPDLPQLTEDAPKTSNDTGTSSMPPVRHRGLMQYGTRSRAPRRIITSSASELPSKETGISSDRPSSPSSPASTAIPEEEQTREGKGDLITPLNQQRNLRNGGSSSRKSKTKSSASRKSARGRSNKSQQQATPKESSPALDADSSMSSLSSVPESTICTPSGLREETPADDCPPSTAASLNPPSTGSRRSLRQKALKAEVDSTSPQTTRHARAAKSHAPFYGSQSTDELCVSATNSVLEKSLVQPKMHKPFRASLAPVPRGGQLFEGMTFALSFQGNKLSAKDRERLQSRIQQAGGAVLEDTFAELFEQSPITSTAEPAFDVDEPMTLAQGWGESGFTALISDSHSRKAKYIQALALGLPCLAHQWVTACLSKGRILDWEPYLLCSGTSAVLDNALKSRNLSPYPAQDARLGEVVDKRRKLLENERILIVVANKNGRSEAKQPYVFLTQALGPIASRVFNAEQAREALKQHARRGTPFDWVYVDKGTALVESVLPELARKRKRNSTGGVRVLNDELIIQSLILGRMVEEDEVCF